MESIPISEQFTQIEAQFSEADLEVFSQVEARFTSDPLAHLNHYACPALGQTSTEMIAFMAEGNPVTTLCGYTFVYESLGDRPPCLACDSVRSEQEQAQLALARLRHCFIIPGGTAPQVKVSDEAITALCGYSAVIKDYIVGIGTQGCPDCVLKEALRDTQIELAQAQNELAQVRQTHRLAQAQRPQDHTCNFNAPRGYTVEQCFQYGIMVTTTCCGVTQRAQRPDPNDPLCPSVR